MKQLDEVQEMVHQRRNCAFQEYQRCKQDQNQKDTIYHIQFDQFHLKSKVALHIYCRKPNLNIQQNHFTIASVSLALFCLCLFFFCCFVNFSFIYCFLYHYADYCDLLLSELHFTITSFLYNTPWNRFYSNYVTNKCPRQLL